MVFSGSIKQKNIGKRDFSEGIHIPVLVLMRNGRSYIDIEDENTITEAVQCALKPYMSGEIVDEYGWLDIEELKIFMENIFTSFTEDPEKSELSTICQELYEAIFDTSSGEYDTSVLQGEKFNRWIKHFGDHIRWDADIEMLMNRRNPEGIIDAIQVGGTFKNMLLWAKQGEDHRKVTGSFVENCEFSEMVQVFFGKACYLVDYKPDRNSNGDFLSESEWYNRYEKDRPSGEVLINKLRIKEWDKCVGEIFYS